MSGFCSRPFPSSTASSFFFSHQCHELRYQGLVSRSWYFVLPGSFVARIGGGGFNLQFTKPFPWTNESLQKEKINGWRQFLVERERRSRLELWPLWTQEGNHCCWWSRKTPLTKPQGVLWTVRLVMVSLRKGAQLVFLSKQASGINTPKTRNIKQLT